MNDERITRAQWRALVAAWLGWAFDGLDGYLFVMVAGRFLAQLVGNEHGLSAAAVAASPELLKDAQTKGAIIQAVFLAGWAIGGAVFGRVGDRLGRSRTLTFTILTYAVFTGLSFFATRWWHLLIFRFLAALGIGGEWAAGSALVSETLHTRHRAWASATLQSGYMVGCILAALTSGWMSNLTPNWVFVVGIAPALLTFWIRWAVPEPAEWSSAAERQKPPPLSALFSPGLRRTTLLTLALTSIALTTVWSFLYYGPRAVEAMPDVKEWPKPDVARLTTRVTVLYLLVNIGGNYFATYLAAWVGYRRAFTLLFVGSLVTFLAFFRAPPTLSNVYWVMGVTAFFSLGLFGLFPLYIPPLFPVLVRTLGAGFTYNVGRLVSGAGTLCGAWITAHTEGPHKVVWWSGLLYIPGLVVTMMIVELGRRRHTGAEITA